MSEFHIVLWRISEQTEMRAGEKYVLCKCACGIERYVRRSSLFIDSFGCRSCSNGLKTHGESRKSKLYNSWTGMRQRCRDRNSKAYVEYGGRGISVCDAWESSFAAFKEWALANGYREGLSIDRIDVNGNYEPSNCRWSTQREQSRNTRRNILVESRLGKMVLKDWCELHGLNYGTTRWRLSTGITLEEIVKRVENM